MVYPGRRSRMRPCPGLLSVAPMGLEPELRNRKRPSSVAAPAVADRPTLIGWGRVMILRRFTRGSSCLATPGWMIAPRWGAAVRAPGRCRNPQPGRLRHGVRASGCGEDGALHDASRGLYALNLRSNCCRINRSARRRKTLVPAACPITPVEPSGWICLAGWNRAPACGVRQSSAAVACNGWGL